MVCCRTVLIMWKDRDPLWSHCFEFMQNMVLGSRESLDISVENCNLNAMSSISFQLKISQCEQARTVCVFLFDFTSETTNHS